MNHKNFGVLGGTALFASMCFGVAQAAPIYVGWSVNGSAITTTSQCNGANGSCTITNQVEGGDFLIQSLTVTGTPPSPEPDLVSGTTDINSSHVETVQLYVSELNQFPTNFSGFVSNFAVSALGGGLTSVTESTYATACSGGNNMPCLAADEYAHAAGNLLSTTTFTSTGTVTQTAPTPTFATTPYVTTLVYTFDFTAVDGNVTAGIDLSTTPIPAALPLFASGLGAMGLFGWRRKRKHTTAIAAA